MTIEPLPGFDAPTAEYGEKLSAGRRLTLRNRSMLASGINPATRKPFAVLNADESCGSCAHMQRQWSGGRSGYLKCDLVQATHGPATDIRASWPACSLWKARHESRD